ncbi:MAG: L,D-transpeptidase family protein, partial [Oscillospiraceae bacterium]|nr:L,D-transpeptidase family protein [Oscillospiraceae bacterium]
TDAYIQKGTDGTYSIVPEDNGDMIDATILMNYTLEQMRNGNNSIQMEDANCYLQAEVKSEDLQTALEECNSLAGLTITYDFEDRQEVLDTSTIADWITADTGGNLQVDKNKIEAWVRENLTKYDTYVPGYTRTFHSTLQGTIEVPLGDYGIYGWKTDVEATAEKLEEYILAGESVTVEPEYSRTAYCRGTDDIGNSYAEVDITNQKVFVYKDGELVVETDCVTGLASDPERATPPGVYRVWTMERNVVLGTYEVQGYEQPVEYWMNFTEIGIGFHDLARSAYGGDIYKTNGSHGCINLPLEAAAKLYDILEIGYPVIVIA